MYGYFSFETQIVRNEYRGSGDYIRDMAFIQRIGQMIYRQNEIDRSRKGEGMRSMIARLNALILLIGNIAMQAHHTGINICST